MKILIIISQYLPAQTPNAHRWQAIIEYFQSQGLDVTVLTTKRSGIRSGELSKGVKVYRTGYNSLKDWLYDLFNVKSRRNEIPSNSNKAKFSSRFLEKLVDKFWRNYYWPDGSKLFINPALKLAKDILEEHQISHIISVGLPFSCHLIAKKIKEYNPSIHWLMDIQDPFSYSKEFWVNNFNKYEDKNLLEEKSTFAKANAISLTNQVAFDNYINLFFDFTHKVKIIPPLLNPPTTIKRRPLLPDNKKYHLAYMGSFYTNVRTPDKFLELLEYIFAVDPQFLDQLHVHFVGQLDRLSQATFARHINLIPSFTFHGLKSKNDAYDILNSASLLLNFGNSTSYHLPSKTVDYLFLNKPVINIILRDDDSSKMFFGSKLEILNLMLGNHESDSELFKRFVQKEHKQASFNEQDTSKFRKEIIGQLYLDLITETQIDS